MLTCYVQFSHKNVRIIPLRILNEVEHYNT